MAYLLELRESLQGLRGILLASGQEIIESDFDASKTRYLLTSIRFLAESVREKKDIKKFTVITENSHVSFFFKDEFLVGVFGEPSMNIPLLEFLVEKEFPKIRVPAKKEEEKKDEVEQRTKSFL